MCEYPVARPAESDLLLHMFTYFISAASGSLDNRSVTSDELSVTQLHQSDRGRPRRRRRQRRRRKSRYETSDRRHSNVGDTCVALKTVAGLNAQADESFRSPIARKGNRESNFTRTYLPILFNPFVICHFLIDITDTNRTAVLRIKKVLGNART